MNPREEAREAYGHAVQRLGAFLVGKLTDAQWLDIVPLVENLARAADAVYASADSGATPEVPRYVDGDWYAILVDGELDATLAVRTRAAAERYIRTFHPDCHVAVIEPFKAAPYPPE